jgi:hypothetical protein
MKLHKVILTKSKLAVLQQSERSLLLLLGHASNEINVLSKLILMITRKDGQPLPRTVDNVEAGQVCVLLRVLMGQLNEAWELFKKRVQADRSIARKYVEELDAEGAAALERLNKHFGSSPLTQIRKKVAFHYTDDANLTEQSFQALPETEPLELYLTEPVGNSFYHASEVIVMFTAIRLAMPGASDDKAAFSALCDDVIEVSRDITELFSQLIGAIATTCMPDLELQTESHPDGPKLSTLSLPYFIDFDR